MRRFLRKKSNENSVFFSPEHENYFIPTQDPTQKAGDGFDNYDTESRNFLGAIVSRRRYATVLVILAAAVIIFFAQSINLQVVKGSYYNALSEGNRIRAQIIPAKRGEIYDRQGILLAGNVPGFDAKITPADLPRNKDQRFAQIEYISEMLEVDAYEVHSLLSEYPEQQLDPIPITNDLDYETAMKIAISAPNIAGLSLEIGNKRIYSVDLALSLSHVLGYIGVISRPEYNELRNVGYRRIDTLGKQGVEGFHESILRGKYGQKIIEVDALGNEEAIITEEKPVNGADLTLTVDAEFQAEIEYFLDQRIGYSSARQSVIVQDPNNGEILALVSRPTFDSNEFAGRIDKDTFDKLLNDDDRPLFPRAVMGEYPPGSTFKLIVGAAGLSEKVISQWTSIFSTGGISLGPWWFPDWKDGGHGATSIRKAISESVNTFFYYVGGGFEDFEGLGVERITDYAHRFGLGSTTGIDLPGESTGFLPSPEWKEEVKDERWYIGDTYHYAIGQGDVLVTPIQVSSYTSVFANGGALYVPHLIKEIHGPDYNEEIQASSRNDQVVSAEIASIIRQGMRQTVTDGSAQFLDILDEPVAGKTGTAQWHPTKDTHAWFTGFGPYKSPEIVVTVLIEEGGEGSSVAAPVAFDIFNWWFNNR